MDFRDLVYLDAIDRYRNLTKAARALYITQPALSNFLRSLEEELNIELFRWNGNTMAPTPAGLEYLDFARKVIKSKKELDNSLQLSAFGRGTLRIGIPFSRTCSFVKPLIIFEKAFPETEIILTEDAYKNLNHMLKACELDLIFTNDPTLDPSHVIRPIFEDEILLYAAACLIKPKTSVCPFSDRPWTDLQALSNYRFLIPPSDQMLGHITERIFAENEFHPARIFRIKNVQAELQLARAGYGLCFYGHPRGTQRLSQEEQSYLYSFGSHPYINLFAAVYSKKLKFPEMAEAFIQIVRNHMNLD
ncbi:LysR family transcriptional regulator [Holdemania filiformis]|uniref:LysR family transcriptional regulator n=1 Tax=Holdemania filiformis TaxID=61171 RepID=A0A412G4J1_9FIRM|nr:LysR family transcriptional regulator [Holdemania filiformis]MBS5001376.1 LysR family transcriptional regulator [Holdemania filiformis]RGR75614.1 LysR family transcriptional regulator [Holdemania filiformis]